MIKEYRFAPQNLDYTFTNADEVGENKLLRGYAIVFNSPSELLSSKTGSFREIIPSDVKITFDDTRALWNHNDDLPLGAVSSNTLVLTPDQTGVYFELSPDRLTPAMLQTIQLGEARMSFGFYANDFTSSVNDAGESLRILNDITVFEVSPVIFPAYSSTNVSFRNLESELIEPSLDLIKTKLKLGLTLLK